MCVSRSVASMGLRTRVSFGSAKPPVAVHFGNDDVVRLMQINGTSDLTLQASFEVPANDIAGLREATDCFRARQSVISVSSSNMLLTHIRVACNASDGEVVEKLCQRNEEWNEASIRQLPIYTNIRSAGKQQLQQELLCVGVNRKVLEQCVSTVEAASLRVRSVTVPIHATLRAFDRLYRRDGDASVTSMVVDIDHVQTIAMIAHGLNLVVAGVLQSTLAPTENKRWHASPALIPAGQLGSDNFERREQTSPRGLSLTHLEEQHTRGLSGKGSLVEELRGCISHHSSLFPDRAIDRIVFTGSGALHADVCASVADDLALQGFIADPSAWISGAEDLASGPVWTTVAGMCLAYSEQPK